MFRQKNLLQKKEQDGKKGLAIANPFLFDNKSRKFYNAIMGKMILDRVAFSVAGYDIYWYGIIMAIAIMFAFIIAIFLFKKKGYTSNDAFEAFLAVVISGLLGARLFSVLMEEGSSIADFFKFRDGGMSIIGAVMGGALGLAVLSLIKRKNFFIYSDVVVVVLILAQAIGRWGNYANQEVYGKVINSKSWQFFPFGVLVDGQWHYALFFYEFVLNLIGFAVLLTLLLKSKKKGLATGAYLTYYGLIRTLLEPLREDTYVLKFLGLPISQTLATVMMTIGIMILTKVISEIRTEKRQKAKAMEGGKRNV